jgi:hypothetical protein
MVSMLRPAVLVRLLPFAVAVALTCATAAVALPPVCDDPECEGGGGGEPVETTFTPELLVTKSAGTVQSSDANINCGVDCAHTYSYTRTCGDPCTYSGIDTVTLTAAGGPAGYSPAWSLCRMNPSTDLCRDSTRAGCDVLGSGNSCQIEMGDDTRAELTWVDTAGPNTGFSFPPAVVGPAVKTFTASATDNSGIVTRVQFFIDNVFVGQDTSSGDGFTWQVNPAAYTDGTTHSIRAQAFDAAGNGDTTPVSTNFTVDRSTQVNITAPAAGAHSQSAPQFSFSIEAGASAVCKTLAGASGDTSLHESACTSTYTPQATAPGEYRVRVTATDAVGNAATVDRAFVIDPPTQQPDGGQEEEETGQPAQPTQPTQPNQPTQPTQPGEVSSAAILAGLGKDLEAAARGLARQRQSKLAKARGRSITVNALTAGTFSLVFKGAAGKAKASRTVTIAKGSVRAPATGRQALRLKLTRAGAGLLRKGGRVSGKLTLTFTRTDRSKLIASRKVALKRR